MRKLILHGGGPAGTGKEIDLDKLCNGDNRYCPHHGYQYHHISDKELKSCPGYEEHKYDAVTGSYLGKVKI